VPLWYLRSRGEVPRERSVGQADRHGHDVQSTGADTDVIGAVHVLTTADHVHHPHHRRTLHPVTHTHARTHTHTHTHTEHESDTPVKATGMIIVTRWLLENNLNVCWAMVLHTRNLCILRYSRPHAIGDRRHTYIYTYKQTLDDAHDSQAQGLNLIGGDTIC